MTKSLAILQALSKIEVDIPESMDVSDEMNHKFAFASYLFDAFKGDMYKRRDVHFNYQLAANMTQMFLGNFLIRNVVDSARKYIGY